MSKGLALSWALYDFTAMMIKLIAASGITMLLINIMRDHGFVPYIEREENQEDEDA